MHWADIQAAIHKAGTTITAIASQEGVSTEMVSMVIRGHRTSHGVAYAIAAVTRIPTERMWPGRYKVAPAVARKRAA